jgi:hypothetical protein
METEYEAVEVQIPSNTSESEFVGASDFTTDGGEYFAFFN